MKWNVCAAVVVAVVLAVLARPALVRAMDGCSAYYDDMTSTEAVWDNYYTDYDLTTYLLQAGLADGSIVVGSAQYNTYVGEINSDQSHMDILNVTIDLDYQYLRRNHCPQVY